MLSLAVRVRPLFLTDADDAGFVAPDEYDECAAATSLARAMGRVDNIDDYLADDAARSERYTRESIALMRSANHQMEPYLEFLRQRGVDVPAALD